MTLGPAYGQDLTVFAPSKQIYIEGSEFANDSWRLQVAGDHPNDAMTIEHYELLAETSIALDDAKVSEIKGGGPPWASNDRYHGTVATDTRANLNIPPALRGDMSGRMIEWDGTLWRNFPNRWVSKATFENSVFSDHGIFRRMNIVNTDPEDGFAYPPVPIEGGVTLGARFQNIEGTLGAHLSETTADGIYGTIPIMVHGDTVGLNVTPNVWAASRADNTPVSTEYYDTRSQLVNYPLGARVVMAGTSYLNINPGQNVLPFHLALEDWAAQNRDLVMDSALTTAAGDVLVDASGDIVRGYSQ